MRYFQWLLLVPVVAALGCPMGNSAKPTTPPVPDKPQVVSDGVGKGDGVPAAPKLAPGTLAITPDNSKIEFTGTKPNGKHDGGFKAFQGGIELADNAIAKISVEIDTDSLFSDNPKLTSHLKAPDFFDVKTHPKAAFASTGIKAEAGKDTTHVVAGDLTLLGVKKAITFPAKVDVAKDAVTLASEFTIKRSEFGMTYGIGKVDDPVTIKVSVKVERK